MHKIFLEGSAITGSLCANRLFVAAVNSSLAGMVHVTAAALSRGGYFHRFSASERIT
jgi:hypothetical protein